MTIIRDILSEDCGYNLRERANVYAGIALGVIAPIAITKYLLPEFGGNSAIDEFIEWGGSIALNSLTSVVFRGVPLLYTTALGAGLGIRRAENLQRKRLERNQGIDYMLQSS